MGYAMDNNYNGYPAEILQAVAQTHFGRIQQPSQKKMKRGYGEGNNIEERRFPMVVDRVYVLSRNEKGRCSHHRFACDGQDHSK